MQDYKTMIAMCEEQEEKASSCTKTQRSSRWLLRSR